MGMSFYTPEWNNDPANIILKRKFRWRLFISGISVTGTNALPPSKAARPSLSFKEMEAQHLNEVIYFPQKPEWKPLQVTLYDVIKGCGSDNVINPVFMWMTRQYDPRPESCSAWKPALSAPGLKAANVSLVLYDGCENVIEEWVYEHAYPQSVDFQDLDMASQEVVVCEVTLRYDRAYIVSPTAEPTIDFETVIEDDPCPTIPPSVTIFGMMEELTFASLF